MNFSSMLLTMSELFLILAVGYVAHRVKALPDSTQSVLTKLLIYITTPCSILNSALSNDDLPEASELLHLLLVATGCYLGAVVVSFLLVRLLRVPKGSRGTYMCMLLFSNCAFIGYPVVSAIFGSEAILYASVLNIPYYPCFYILGVLLMLKDSAQRSGTQQKLKLKWSDLASPCVLASIVAVVVTITGWKAPELLTGAIASLGNVTTPCALLAIGIAIGKMPLRSVLGSPRIYLVCLLRLFLMPVLVWLALQPFLTDPIALGVAVVIFGMPTATMVSMLAAEYHADEQAAVQAVFLSTVFSIFTIPIMVSVLL